MSNLFFPLVTPLASHQWLLSEDIDLLPALLLPLAGPEQFGEDETERLPLDLQFLPDDKQREPDPDLRKMLIEARLAGQTLTRGGEVWSNSRLVFVLHTQQQGA